MSDAEVKEKDIEAIEREIADKDKAKETKMKEDIEAKIRDDLQKEKEMDEMKAKVAAYEESKKKQEEDKVEYEKNLKLQSEQHEEELNKAKEQIGSSKQIHNLQQGQQTKRNFDSNELSEIESKSREAFFVHADPNRNRG